MKKVVLFVTVLICNWSYSQEQIQDPISNNNKVNSIYLSTGLNSVHYSNYSGVYDSISYSIDNSVPCLNYGIGYIGNLYLNKENIKNRLLFSYGGEIASRQFKVYYNSENISIKELFLLPMIGIGVRSEIKHSLWLINSYKAIEFKLVFGAPILLSQNSIINHSRVKSSNSLYVKYHLGFDVKFSSLQNNGRGHQFGTEIFIENSKQDTANTIPFKTPYYLGFRLYYCILNMTK